MPGSRGTAVAMVLVMLVTGCGTPRSFWLKTAAPGEVPVERTCWDTCQAKWNEGTLELTSCVESCPEVESRPVACPKDAAAQCVGGPGKGFLYLMLGALAVGLLIGITLKVVL